MTMINNTNYNYSYQELIIEIEAFSIYTYRQPFNSFNILSSTSPELTFRLGKSGESTRISQGLGWKSKTDEALPELTIENLTSAKQQITLGIALGDIQDNRLTVSGAIDTIQGSYKVSEAQQLEIAVGETNLDNTAYKRIIIQNIGEIPLIVQGLTVQPQGIFDFSISANILIQNNEATATGNISVLQLN